MGDVESLQYYRATGKLAPGGRAGGEKKEGGMKTTRGALSRWVCASARARCAPPPVPAEILSFFDVGRGLVW